MSNYAGRRGGAHSSRGSRHTSASHATELNANAPGESHITAPAALFGGVWETAIHAADPHPNSKTSTEPSSDAGASQQSQPGAPQFSQQVSGPYDEPEPEPDSPGKFNFNSYTTRVPAQNTGPRGPTTPIPIQIPAPNPAWLKTPVAPSSAFPFPSPAPSRYGGGGVTPRLSTKAYPYSSGAPSASPRARPPTPPPLPTLGPILAASPVRPREPPSSPRTRQDTETISLLMQLNRCVLKNGTFINDNDQILSFFVDSRMSLFAETCKT